MPRGFVLPSHSNHNYANGYMGFVLSNDFNSKSTHADKQIQGIGTDFFFF
jgi:hypothetical protein